MKRNIAVYIIFLIVIGVMLVTLSKSGQDPEPKSIPDPDISVIVDFDDCVAAGNAIMESYPEQCRSKDGQLFVRDTGNELEKANLIRISSPRPNAEISSPLLIEGEAVGNWFFEGDFPIVLLDSNNNIVARSFATAQSDSMTEDFVKFKALIEFIANTARGELLLLKDNPSGLPENEDGLRVPVLFSPIDSSKN